MRRLGAALPSGIEGDFVVNGAGLHGLCAPVADLDCGNSGTSARHLLGVVAGGDFRSIVTGDASLRTRPMRRVTEPLARAGAQFRELEAPDRLPIEVRGGPLDPIEHDSPHASAQVKSALLLAALTGGTTAIVSEPTASRDHTERMLAAMGAPLAVGMKPHGPFVRLGATERLEPLDITVPGDVSTAAFFVAFAILAGTPVLIEDVGLNPTRTGFLDVVRRMGAEIDLLDERVAGGEPIGTIHVAGGSLAGGAVGGAELVRMIDEVPVLAILAARAQGETRITGAKELRVKESDRISALVSNLRAIGVTVDELDDGIVVQGTNRRLAGAVKSHGDHRIAMAFGVLSALPDAELRIDDSAVAAVSDPAYWTRLHSLAGGRA
jgi:3-phosphoshikimate 1-carboxyvinyltransferase